MNNPGESIAWLYRPPPTDFTFLFYAGVLTVVIAIVIMYLTRKKERT